MSVIEDMQAPEPQPGGRLFLALLMAIVAVTVGCCVQCRAPPQPPASVSEVGVGQ